MFQSTCKHTTHFQLWGGEGAELVRFSARAGDINPVGPASSEPMTELKSLRGEKVQEAKGKAEPN